MLKKLRVTISSRKISQDQKKITTYIDAIFVHVMCEAAWVKTRDFIGMSTGVWRLSQYCTKD